MNTILQVLAIALTMISLIMLGNKNRKAFILFVITNLLVIYLTLQAKPLVWSTIGVNIVFIAFNIRNFVKWGK